jgi:hypothetical protein
MADEIGDQAVVPWRGSRMALPLLLLSAGLLHAVVFVYSTDFVENGPTNATRSMVAGYLRYALVLIVAGAAFWLLRRRGYTPFRAAAIAAALSIFVTFAGPAVFVMLIVASSAFI